jgi:putative oxidoreductase
MALRVIDSLALRYEPVILLLGRLCIGSLFLMSGINHWLDLKLVTHFVTGLPGSVQVWAMLAATVEVVSGAAMVLGFRTREFALPRRSAIPIGRSPAMPPRAGVS